MTNSLTVSVFTEIDPALIAAGIRDKIADGRIIVPSIESIEIHSNDVESTDACCLSREDFLNSKSFKQLEQRSILSEENIAILCTFYRTLHRKQLKYANNRTKCSINFYASDRHESLHLLLDKYEVFLESVLTEAKRHACGREFKIYTLVGQSSTGKPEVELLVSSSHITLSHTLKVVYDSPITEEGLQGHLDKLDKEEEEERLLLQQEQQQREQEFVLNSIIVAEQEFPIKDFIISEKSDD